jgi:hypothetical protein
MGGTELIFFLTEDRPVGTLHGESERTNIPTKGMRGEYLDEFIVEVGDGLTGLFTELMNMWMLIHLHVSPGLCA